VAELLVATGCVAAPKETQKEKKKKKKNRLNVVTHSLEKTAVYFSHIIQKMHFKHML
jgi:hypothetical protein